MKHVLKLNWKIKTPLAFKMVPWLSLLENSFWPLLCNSVVHLYLYYNSFQCDSEAHKSATYELISLQFFLGGGELAVTKVPLPHQINLSQFPIIPYCLKHEAGITHLISRLTSLQHFIFSLSSLKFSTPNLKILCDNFTSISIDNLTRALFKWP